MKLLNGYELDRYSKYNVKYEEHTISGTVKKINYFSYKEDGMSWFSIKLYNIEMDRVINVSGFTTKNLKEFKNISSGNLFLTGFGVYGKDNYGYKAVFSSDCNVSFFEYTQDDVFRFFKNAKNIGEVTISDIWWEYRSSSIFAFFSNFENTCKKCRLNKRQKESLYEIVNTNNPYKIRFERFPKMSDALFYFIINEISDSSSKMQMFDDDFSDLFLNKVNTSVLYKYASKNKSLFVDIDSFCMDTFNINAMDEIRINAILMLGFNLLTNKYRCLGFYFNDVGNFSKIGFEEYYDICAKLNIKSLNTDYEFFTKDFFLKSIKNNDNLVLDFRELENKTYITTVYNKNMLEYVSNILHKYNIENKEKKELVEEDVKNVVKKFTNLNVEQKMALENILCSRMSFLSGGPGRGKTYLISAVISCWRELFGNNFVVLGPTGKSVNRIMESLSYMKNECSTLASFILKNELMDVGCDKFVKPKYRNKYDISKNVLVIVDEVSMVTIKNIKHLFSIMDGCSFLFVGDKDQLPPIESGDFLKEVLKTDFPCQFLVENMRTSNKEIVTNSDKIINSDFNLDFCDCFSFEKTDTYNDFVVQWYEDRISKISMSEIMVLTPFNDVVKSLNKQIQDKVNKDSDSLGVLYHGYKNHNMYIKINDRVMCCENNSEAIYEDDDGKGFGIFNGDIGYITNFSPYDEIFTFVTDSGKKYYFSLDEIDLFVPAYVLTIHKSQGSEASDVCVVLPKKRSFSDFLNRQLLYTAVTRAKNNVVICGSYVTFSNCISTSIKDNVTDLSYEYKKGCE